jgi:hypothetical protein
MSGEYDPHFQSLQIETCTSKLIVKTMIKQQWYLELTLQSFAGHVKRFMANCLALIVRISVGVWVQNPQIETIEDFW